MRLHNITITPRSVTIDGQRLTVEESGPRIDPIGAGVSIVHLPVIARTVTLQGDTHDPDEPTPIYDQLVEETYGQILHNCELNGRPVRVKFHKGADQ
nr:MAG TPA_asm: hypothetical protein [Caudoviricetes sp.]